MKKGQIYEGIVTKVDFPNKGRVEIEGEKVTVKNGLTGQKIRFSINKKKNGKAEGRLLEILERSPLETREKNCKSFGDCGGCSYQTLPYEEQLRLKEDQVRDLLNSVVPDYQWEGIIGSPKEWGYRNKMEFSFGDEYKDGPLSLGLHKKGSFHDILTVDDCALVDSDYNQILSTVLEYCTDQGLDYYRKLSHQGYLRHLLIRKAVKTEEILANIITSAQREHDFTDLKDCLLSLNLQGEIVGFLHTLNDSLADVVQADSMRLLYGREYIYEEILGLRFKITTSSFFQTNSLGAEVLYSKVREYVGETKDKNIFDLYSGTGTIAQLLAPVASKVTGVEIVEEAVEAAKVNAGLNGLNNCEFIAGDVLKVIDDLKDKPDIIILDPPRDGIHPKALDRICNFGVGRIVYISCKPTSLVRDLEVLKEKGYEMEKACAVDMFPQGVHVETCCLLYKVK